MRVRFVSCLVPWLAACASAGEPPAPPPAPSVEGLPAVAEARAAWEASQGRAEQAALWPNPKLRLMARDVPTNPTVLERGGRWIELMQPIAVGGRIAAGATAAEADREAMSCDLESARLRALGDVATAAAEAESARAVLAAVRALAVADEQALVSARNRHAQGAASDADVAALEAAAGRTRAEVSVRAAESAGAEAALRALVPDGSPPRLSAAPAASFESHPDVRAAELRVRAAEARLDEARAERVPDVELSLSYGRVGETDESMVEAGVTVPLPVFDRNQGRVREALHLVAAARAAHERVTRDVVARIARSTVDVAAAAEAHAAYRDRVVPAAEALLAQMERGRASGVRSEIELIAARRGLAEARVALAEAERRHRLAEARRIALFGAVTAEDVR